jgi:hypothetical protein
MVLRTIRNREIAGSIPALGSNFSRNLPKIS